MSAELYSLTIAEQARLIETKRLSPVELTRHYLQRIDALNPMVHAFAFVMHEQALAAAAMAEAEIMSGHYRGPLHGIPVSVKDFFDTAGIPTTGQSRIFQHRIPDANAWTVDRLLEAGAVLLGKNTTHEFGHGGPSFDLPWPPALNPWNLDRFTGGSSSGCGSAIAAGLVSGSLATDARGSIRIPAAMCGISGLKPTFGRTSRTGLIETSATFDHIGPLAWTTEDCAILLQVIAGYDRSDPASADCPVPDFCRALVRCDLEGIRLGIVRHFHERELVLGDEQIRLFDEAVAVFTKLGAKSTSVTLPSLQEFGRVHSPIQLYEIYQRHRAVLTSHAEVFSADFRSRVEPGAAVTREEYDQAQVERRTLADAVDRQFEAVDVLVTAGPYGPAPRLVDAGARFSASRPSITGPFNVTGHPALMVCCGFGSDGLPFGFQIVGQQFDEATVLALGNRYESATTWRTRRPSIASVEIGNRIPGGFGPLPEFALMTE